MLHKYLPGSIRERIQDLLLEHNMTQAQLAERIGISESSLNRFLSGQTDKLSSDNVMAIAGIFHVSTDFLLGLTDIPYRTNYDLEKLGLSAQAAKNLLTNKVNANMLSALLEMPTFTVKPSSSQIIRRIFSAASRGLPQSRSVPVISTQASSMEYCSTTGRNERSPSTKWRLHST